jgi:hypothetical protein
MNPLSRPRFVGQRSEKTHPALVQSIDQHERTINRKFRIGPRRPHILVISLYRRMVLGHNGSEPQVRVDVRIGNMVNHLARSPPPSRYGVSSCSSVRPATALRRAGGCPASSAILALRCSVVSILSHLSEGFGSSRRAPDGDGKNTG